MLDDDQMLVELAQRGDTELASGYIDREYARVCAASEKDQGTMPTLKYPILNFFGGTVTSDRHRHENAAQHGGLKYWRNNTSKQRVEDNALLHLNASGRVDYDIQAPQAVNAYGAAQLSTGMGLEEENLHSFITTGTHYKVIPIVPPEPLKNIFPVHSAEAEAQQAPQVVACDNENIATPSLAQARGALYSYRSKASKTYTDLPAMAVNQ